MHLVLIDSRIQDINSVIGSLTENTNYIVFDFYINTIDSIKSQINSNYENVAIIQHKYNIDVYRFLMSCSSATLTDLENVDPELTSWTEYIQFLQWLKDERGVQYIDLLACNLWSDANWKYMIENVRSRYGIYIRASLDITGEGGDFILESDNIDTIGLYFTQDILNYKYSFFGYQTSQEVGYDNYKNYVLPTSNLAKVSNRYSSMLTRTPPATYTDVVSIVANHGATAILRSDGTVVLQQHSVGYGGTMPVGIVSQSDLVNIKKVVPSGQCFAAIKNDGTVVCWGFLSTGSLTQDINTVVDENNQNPNQRAISVDSVRSQLVDVVDIFATALNSFAALTIDGRVVTWGYRLYGGGEPNEPTQRDYKSRGGIIKVLAGYSHFAMLNNVGNAMIILPAGNYPAAYFSVNAFGATSFVADIYVTQSTSVTVCLVEDGTTYTLRRISAGTIYTLPQDVSIIKFRGHPNNYQINMYWLLSNNTVVAHENGGFTLFSNVTDIETNGLGGGGAFAMIQNGTVVTRGAAGYGGNVASALNPNYNVNNAVRLYSTYNSFAVLKSDNTVVLLGVVGNYGSAALPDPSNADQVSFYNTLTNNVKAVYACADGYATVKFDGSIATIGIRPITQTTTGTKDANTNVYFEQVQTVFYALEIPFSPSLTPSSILQATASTVSYYVSDPDLMCLSGRKYQLFNGATVLDTFYPKFNNHTYVFSNVFILNTGTYNLDIKDVTNTVSTVASFSLTVRPVTQNRWVAAGHSPATGGSARIAYSRNGIDWTLSSNATSVFGARMEGRYCVSHNGVLWVAGSTVSTGGTSPIGYSYDGDVWYPATSGNGILTSIVGIAYGNDMFVAVGTGPTFNVMVSSNGMSWTGVASNVLSDGYNGIMFANDRWVIFGRSTTNPPRAFATSQNAINWTPTVSSNFTEVGGIDYNGLNWVVVGNGPSEHVMYTTDITSTLTSSGLGRTIYTASGQAHSVNWNGSRYIVVGRTGSGTSPILSSVNGRSWVTVSSARFNTNGGGVRTVNAQYGVWVLGQEFQTGSATNNLLYSLDNGATWTDASTNVFGANSIVNTIAHVNDPPYPCFLQGTKIKRFNAETYQEEYVEIEKLRKNDLILTAESGYKAIHKIGYRTLFQPKNDPRSSNRLYKFTKNNCPGVFEPLYITGEHCTLHSRVSDEQLAKIKEHMGDVYITEEFYRMPACVDERAEPYDKDDTPVIIWHFALEHENVCYNYGVYANGLLVESCAIESIIEKSGMTFIEE